MSPILLSPDAIGTGVDDADDGTSPFRTIDGQRYAVIDDVSDLDPFLMSVTGASDVWMFLSSSGGITAGRRNAGHAIFPYYTEDKLTDHAHRVGGLTICRGIDAAGEPWLWEPFLGPTPPPGIERSLAKSTLGDVVVFEETHHELGLQLRVSWRTSARFGVVRRVRLTPLRGGSSGPQIEVLDGFVNLLPAGIGTRTQNELSNLLDAYKRTELRPSGLGLSWLSSMLTDLAEPSESLSATVAWQTGLPATTRLLCERQLPDFRRGRAIRPETDVRGERSAYLTHAAGPLPATGWEWTVVADTAYDTARVLDLENVVTDPGIGAVLARDAAADRDALRDLVAAVDGVQDTGEETACVHHSANVLFNAMRGGMPPTGYHVNVADVRAFLQRRSGALRPELEAALATLPARLTTLDLLAWADRQADPSLARLVRLFLPLTFSRRHGDPSRPWNAFDIAPRDPERPRLAYQGNWRDIFQNWEALSWSYPMLTEQMVVTFLDATTIDGYNPYRITESGIDWEVPEPDNPWSNIGYWSDHQIVYLLSLVEQLDAIDPGRLARLLDAPICAYADVPYRIAGYPQLVADPRATITFDAAADARIRARAEREGGDGLLVHARDGSLLRATVAEKLLLLLAAKLANLVPLGGIWMNTQRPEWNDANNALVGRGLSVVTLAHLRRYAAYLRPVLAREVTVPVELDEFVRDLGAILAEHRDVLTEDDDRHRRIVLDALGAAGSRYRAAAYAGLSETRVALPAEVVTDLIDLTVEYADATLAANRRPDGLLHSYNTLDLDGGCARIGRLPVMLEGQVAVLASGVLSPAEAAHLLGALRQSALYRGDARSYQLYPDKDLAGFVERNRFRLEAGPVADLVAGLAAAADRSIVVTSTATSSTGDTVVTGAGTGSTPGGGLAHFAPGMRNAGALTQALDRLSADSPELAPLVEAGRAGLLAAYEEVFTHRDFTGRSGSFFAYEGLGSIYWHMVAKLLLATQAYVFRAADAGDRAVAAELAGCYEDIRSGLGYRKSAREYGAFPTDPYSHTPAGKGARQPGMTGQVKEEVITRFGELGVRFRHGSIALDPVLLRASEWRADGTAAFTLCGTPVLLRRMPAGSPLAVTVTEAGGARHTTAGALRPEHSRAIWSRDGSVIGVEVAVPDGYAVVDQAVSRTTNSTGRTMTPSEPTSGRSSLGAS
jgi:hypothetical protein